MNRGNGRRRRRRGNRGRPPNPLEWVGGPLSLPQCPLSHPATTTTTNSATTDASLSECRPSPAGPLHLQPITRFCRVQGQDTHPSGSAPSTHPFMDWRSLARVQRLLQDAAPSQRERLFWDVYTQLAEYFGQPCSPLQGPATYRSLTRLSPSPWNQVTFYNRTDSNRYEEEFEEVTVLGDGGFGHVVKARNKLDGCYYAIKIIDMGDKDGVSLDQSLQEVRALAKLNNHRVVRYHNAWLQLNFPALPSVGSSSSDSEDDDEEDVITRTSTDRSGDDNGVVIRLPSHHQRSHESTDDGIIFQSSGNGQRHSVRLQGSGGGPSNRALLPYRPPQSVPRPRKTLYIQMGLCGDSLKDWLDQRNKNAEPVAKDRCMVIFRELTEALAYIHDLDLIHRDVKPANIFFTLGSCHHHIQLGDFGLAKQSVQPPTSRLGAASDLVPLIVQRNTSRVGTKLYTAPEVDRGSSYGQKSDIFSAGITLLELLSSFSTGHQRAQEIQHLREDRRLDPELRRRWPDTACLILQLTDPEPANRPSSEELLTMLRFDPFSSLSSPANTMGTAIAPTAVLPDPGLANVVVTAGEAIRSMQTYRSVVNCIEAANRPSSEDLPSSPLYDPFPPPLSPANTAGTAVAPTAVPPDPGLANGVLAMGEAIGGVETYRSEVNDDGSLPVRSLEVSYVTESSSVISTIQRQVSEAEENVILREENLMLKRKVEELERKLQHLRVAENTPPTHEK